MRLGTEDALTVALQQLGLSGRLNTAFIERVNLTVRNAGGGTGPPHLGHRTAVPTASGQSGMVARVLSLCASSRSAAGEARAAARTRGQPSGATVPTTDAGDGSWQNHSTMDDARSALVPLAADYRLRATQA
jgi:hypothetical protein